MPNDPFDLATRPPVIGRIVTATVALVCVLIVYDGWATLEPIDVVLVIVGPVIAICTTHVFSGSVVQLVELGRWPTMREWLVMARFESRFLLLAVPPLVVLLVLRLADVALVDAVRGVIWLEALSLGFWVGLAGWYAGLRGRLLVVSILAGLVISGVVLLLKVVLQPGRAGLWRRRGSNRRRHPVRMIPARHQLCTVSWDQRLAEWTGPIRVDRCARVLAAGASVASYTVDRFGPQREGAR